MNLSFNWDTFPSTKLELTRLLAPLGCLFQKTNASVPGFNAFPTKCPLCGAFTNRFTVKDTESNTLWCPFCHTRFQIPKDIHPETGALPDVETVDYIPPKDISQPIGSRGPVVLYVVDLYQQVDCPEEFTAMKERILESISRLPSSASVGLITFSNTITLHGGRSVLFSLDDLPKGCDSSGILGDKPAIAKILLKIAESSSTNIWKGLLLLQSGFLQSPESLKNEIDALKPNLTRSFKPERVSGFALLIASCFLQCASSSLLLGNVKLFSSGPCTIGPGKVVDVTETIRTHDHIANLKAPHFMNAAKFYRALSFIGSGYTIDQAYAAAFSLGGSLTHYNVSSSAPKFTFDLHFGSLDQVGLYEMYSLSSGLGGTVIFSDSFTRHSFKTKLEAVDSLPKVQDVVLTVHTSVGLKVSYSLSYGTPYQSSYQSTHLMEYHHGRISDTISGFESLMKKRHFTNRWYLGDLKDSVGCVLFEVDPIAISKAKAKHVYIQFQLDFWDPETQKKVTRVTTTQKPTTMSIFASSAEGEKKISRLISENARQKALLAQFNPETWITILTRLLISKIDTTLGFESFEEVIQLMDKTLIKLTNFFGVMKKEASASSNPLEKLKALYSIDEHFRSLPVYAYYLRKNPQLVSIFNSSPDETAYYHHLFMGLLVEDSCLMIQPRFYHVVDGQMVQKPAETSSIQKAKGDSFFILDSFHTIIIYLHSDRNRLKLHSSDNDDIVYGRTNDQVNKTIDLAYCEIIENRSFVPKIVLTQTGHSQARFLLSRLLPPNNIIEDGAKTKKKWWHFDTVPKAITTKDISSEKYCEELLSRAESLRIEDEI